MAPIAAMDMPDYTEDASLEEASAGKLRGRQWIPRGGRWQWQPEPTKAWGCFPEKSSNDEWIVGGGRWQWRAGPATCATPKPNLKGDCTESRRLVNELQRTPLAMDAYMLQSSPHSEDSRAVTPTAKVTCTESGNSTGANKATPKQSLVSTNCDSSDGEWEVVSQCSDTGSWQLASELDCGEWEPEGEDQIPPDDHVAAEIPYPTGKLCLFRAVSGRMQTAYTPVQDFDNNDVLPHTGKLSFLRGANGHMNLNYRSSPAEGDSAEPLQCTGKLAFTRSSGGHLNFVYRAPIEQSDDEDEVPSRPTGKLSFSRGTNGHIGADYHGLQKDAGVGESLASTCTLSLVRSANGQISMEYGKSQKVTSTHEMARESMDAQQILGSETTQATFFVNIGAGRWKVHSAQGKRGTFFVSSGPGRWKVQSAVGRTQTVGERSYNVPLQQSDDHDNDPAQPTGKLSFTRSCNGHLNFVYRTPIEQSHDDDEEPAHPAGKLSFSRGRNGHMSVDYQGLKEDAGAGESLPSTSKLSFTRSANGQVAMEYGEPQKVPLTHQMACESMDLSEQIPGSQITKATFFVNIGAGRWKVHSAQGKQGTFFMNSGPGRWKVQCALGSTPATAERMPMPCGPNPDKLSLRRKDGKSAWQVGSVFGGVGGMLGGTHMVIRPVGMTGKVLAFP